MIICGRVLFSAIIQQVFMHVNMHPVDCSFEVGLCGWRDPYNFSSGNLSLQKNGTNSYLQLGSSYFTEHTTHVESMAVQNSSIQCLKFFYMTKRSTYTDTFYSGALNVTLVYNNSEHPLMLLREGNIENKWQIVLLNINNMQKHETFRIRLTATIEKNDVMNIDNIQLLDGVCRMDCDFEEDVCGWMISNFSKSTYTNGTGHYLLAKGKNVNASMTSTSIYLEDFQCVTFLYQMSEDYKNKIELLVQGEVGLITRDTWTRSADMGYTWHNAIVETEVANISVIKMIIQVFTGDHYVSSIGVDNISIRKDSCLDCTFSEGFCNWEGGLLWQMNKNAPTYAYTICTDDRNESSLISKSDISPGPKCLILRYLIQHGDSTYIMVKSTEGQIISTKSEIIRNTWTEVHTNINLARKSRIIFSFVHRDGCYGQYYIMNISLKKGLCPAKATDHSSSTSTTNSTSTGNETDAPNCSDTAISIADHNGNIIICTTTVTTTTASTAAGTLTTTGLSPTEVGGIIGTVIGCFSMGVAVLLLIVFIYRRRRSPTIEKKAPQCNTVANRTYMGALRAYNIAQNPSSSSTDKKQRISENVHYTSQADYATVENKKPQQNETLHISAQGNANVYPLVESLLDNDRINVTHPEESHRLKQNSDNSEETNSYDTLYDTRGSLPDSTYDHTNKFSDDTYDSTKPSTKRTFDETYNHTTFDSTYNRTICTDYSTYNTTICSPNQNDSKLIYELAGNDVFERDYEIHYTPARSVDV